MVSFVLSLHAASMYWVDRDGITPPEYSKSSSTSFQTKTFVAHHDHYHNLNNSGRHYNHHHQPMSVRGAIKIDGTPSPSSQLS